MQRQNRCFVCGREQTTIAYSQDPWCSDNCHKRLAFILGMQQWDLNADEFESAMRRLAKTAELGSMHVNTSEIAEEIKRGRNYREVYGSEDLLRKAERSGNWRDSELRDSLEGWVVPRVR